VGRYTYLAVLGGCLAAALWLEPVLRVGVLRRWRRLLLTLVPVVLVFGAWDLVGIATHNWSYDPRQTLGIVLPGRMPLEELLFFVVVPACAVLGYEAVRKVLRR
jgi:lycopene cyclase domain-containing protein